MKTFLPCVAIGTAATLCLFGLGYVAAEAGARTLSFALYWQAYVMQMSVPCTLDNTGEFLCLDLGLARIIFWAGLPVGVVVYSALAWAGLTLLRRSRAAAPAPPASPAPPAPRSDD